jgi:glycosyltransferase involved in cell wall biosynthesis
MKILIFNWRDIYNPHGGGAEVFTQEITKRWIKQRHQVTMFTSSFPGCKREEIIDGVRIIRDGGKISVYSKAKQYYQNFFSQDDYDIIIDEINTRPFFTPYFVNNGTKIVALIHQLAREFWFYETSFPINYIGYHILENRWLKKYVDIPTVTVSDSTKKDLINLGFKNVFVVSEGITFNPLNQVPKKGKKPTIVFLGRLKSAKRPQYIIKAFEKVIEIIPDAKLNIVGDGPLRKKLEQIACKEVEFFGHVSEKEKIKLLSEAWLLIHPSVREGWGINVIEANACGTPCIAYDVGGLRDSIIDGKTGILIKGNANIDKLTIAITELLTNKKKRETLTKNALKWSTHFNWDKSAKEFMNVLESIAQ